MVVEVRRKKTFVSAGDRPAPEAESAAPETAASAPVETPASAPVAEPVAESPPVAEKAPKKTEKKVADSAAPVAEKTAKSAAKETPSPTAATNATPSKVSAAKAPKTTSAEPKAKAQTVSSEPAKPAAKAPTKTTAKSAASREAGSAESSKKSPAKKSVDAKAPADAEASTGTEGTEGDANARPNKRQRKKLSRAQREEVARQKSEDLVTKRLAQLGELREQKRLEEKRRSDLKELEARKPKPAATPEATRPAPPRRRRKPRRGQQNRGMRGQGNKKPSNFKPPAPVVRDVIIPEAITVGELSARMAVKASEVVKLLFNQGMMVTVNQTIDQDTAVLVVEELGHKPKPVSEGAQIEAELADSEDKAEDQLSRPPVVTVMGHVDHGKTSLLDAIRKTDVTSREFGGITQHIGAYQVALTSGAKISFLDTPGHAAFTSMRARGAQVTDIVILVVAADDGVMPQTIEAINHAKEAKVPIIVAVNKIDRPNANSDRVMQQLVEHELVPEAWGGETLFVKVSAQTGEGIEELEEMILLQAEMLSLVGNPGKEARGAIVEAKLDKGRGPVATCLVQNGTLKRGDIFVVGSEWGKVRMLLNHRGDYVEDSPPGTPVEIIGLSGVPDAGDELVVVQDERRAREIAMFRANKIKEQERARSGSQANLNDLFTQIQQGEVEELKVVLKADVQGSVEAVSDALTKIIHEQVRVTVVHTGVGGINESDVMLAMASNALVLGFNVRADAMGRELAKREQIDIRFYNVIYDLVDHIRGALEGMLRPKFEEEVQGHAEVRQVFRISKIGNVAGCFVTDGVVFKKSLMRLLRDSVVVFDGDLSALKRYKDDAKEVREGMECGISLDRFNDVKAGDVLEAYKRIEVRQTIDAS